MVEVGGLIGKISILILALSIIAGVIIYSTDLRDIENGGEEGERGIISLVKPPFIASATELMGGGSTALQGTTFLEEEAGISAYVNVAREIDLEKAKTAFKSIETANESYIIGQIALEGYNPEYVAPHAYVHKDGWIITYYLKNEPSSKIMQWNGYGGGKITTTTLADAIKKVCDAITFNYNTIKSNLKYYDFEYPNANRMMLITEWIEGGGGKVYSDQFNLTIPTECELYEASWSHHFSSSSRWWQSRVKITDADYYPVYTISEFKGRSNYTNGEFTPEQLSADGMLHIVTVEHDVQYGSTGYGRTGVAVVLIYKTS